MKTNFTNKTHYQSFRQAWANAVNSVTNKSYTKSCDEIITIPNTCGQYEISTGTGSEKVPAPITAEHMVLFNLLLDRPIHTGFTPITNKTKLANGAYINQGFYFAVSSLSTTIKIVKKLLNNEGKQIVNLARRYDIERIEKLISPFNGTVTLDMLANLQIPKVTGLSADFGKGKQLFKDGFTTNDIWEACINPENTVYNNTFVEISL